MKKLFLFFLFVVLFFVFEMYIYFEFFYEIKGEVFEDGIGIFLIGVMVMEKGMKNGVMIDVDGKFFLKFINLCVSLVLFYMGY